TGSIREIPVTNVGGRTVAARLAVGAERVKVIRLTMRAWIGVLVGATPRVFGEPLNVRAVPVSNRGVIRLLDERIETVVRRRIHRVVETVFGEGGLESLDILLRLGNASLPVRLSRHAWSAV